MTVKLMVMISMTSDDDTCVVIIMMLSVMYGDGKMINYDSDVEGP